MKPIIDFLGSAYLVNLPERVDRLETTRKELERVGCRVEPGQVTLHEARRFTDAAGFESPGVRGCFDSHLSCFRKAVQNGSRGVLMLEDDIAFTSVLKDIAPALVQYLDTHPWDLMYFGHEGTGTLPRANSATRAKDVKFRESDGDILCTHFYAVNGKTLPRLILFLEQLMARQPGDPVGGPMPIDGALHTFRRQNRDIKTLLAVPKLGWQRPSRSDLTPSWIDRMAWARGLVGGLRFIKHRAQRWRA